MLAEAGETVRIKATAQTHTENEDEVKARAVCFAAQFTFIHDVRNDLQLS